MAVSCGNNRPQDHLELDHPKGGKTLAEADPKPEHTDELLLKINETLLAQTATIKGLEFQIINLNSRMDGIEGIIRQQAVKDSKSKDEESASIQPKDNQKIGRKVSPDPGKSHGNEAAKAKPNSKPASVTLWQAASNGDLEAIERLSKDGESINGKDASGWTPLFWGVAVNSKQAVKLLLEKGADANLRNNEGKTPLDWAIQTKATEIVELLKERGAKKGNEL